MKKIIVPYYVIIISIIALFTSDTAALLYEEIRLPFLIGSLSPGMINLKGIPVIKQPNGHTCAITAVTIVSNYLNNRSSRIPEMIRRYGVDTERGANINELSTWLSKELPSQRISYHSGQSNAETVGEIHRSLSAGYPVVVVFGAPNPGDLPYYDIHASVVCGADFAAGKIFISNAYGFKETITLDEFFSRMSFSFPGRYPPSMRKYITDRNLTKNMFFIIQ